MSQSFQGEGAFVGVDGQAPAFILGILGDINGNSHVVEAKLFENDGGLESVRRVESVVG